MREPTPQGADESIDRVPQPRHPGYGNTGCLRFTSWTPEAWYGAATYGASSRQWVSFVYAK